MLIYFVFFVCMNILMIRTEDNIIKIEINKKGEGKCNVAQEVKLLQNSNFTLKIISEYFIVKSKWKPQYNIGRYVDFKHSNLSITYERSVVSTKEETKNTFKFASSHAEHPPIIPGPWIFKFDLLKNYDPWSFQELQTRIVETWECSTHVKIDEEEDLVRIISANHGSDKSNDDDKKWLVIVLAIIGALLLVSTSYIITGKIRGRESKVNQRWSSELITLKSPKVKRGSKPERNIADRPPLPLPPDEVTKDVPLMQKQSHRNKGLDTSEEEVISPSCAQRYMDVPLVPKHSYRHKVLPKLNEEIRSPGSRRRHETRMEGHLVLKQSYRNEGLKISEEELRSPGIGRRHKAPLVPKKPYKNKALENSLEELRTPDFGRRHEGPLVPKQSYRNNVLDDSDEEIRTPSFARRQIEAILVQLPPKLSASKSFKKPIPRQTSSPPTPPEKIPICPASSKAPAPPLHPKTVAATFPSQQETGRPQDSRRFSDDEWQYEQLQPDSKYLNTNFTVDNLYT